VAEQGRPGELLAHGGRHAEFVRARERAEGWRLSAEPA